MGPSLDTFLDEDGIREIARGEVSIRVIARQLAQEMERHGRTKAKSAELMHTSCTQVGRLLNAKGNITIGRLHRAAPLVGREIRLELV